MRVACLRPRLQSELDFRGGTMDRECNWRDEPLGFYLLFLTAAVSFVALVLCVVYVATLP